MKAKEALLEQLRVDGLTEIFGNPGSTESRTNGHCDRHALRQNFLLGRGAIRPSIGLSPSGTYFVGTPVAPMKTCTALILVLLLVVASTRCAAATRIISSEELISACENNKAPCTLNTCVAVQAEILRINIRDSGGPWVTLKGRDDHVNVQCFFAKLTRTFLGRCTLAKQSLSPGFLARK
jgi:hypothetical protein